MKKIALMILLILVLTLTFTACGNTAEKTNATPRWNNEHFEFAITKAVLKESYTYNNETYTDEPVASTYERNPDLMQQFVPTDIGGSFTMDIALGASNQCTFTTKQVLYSQYETEKLQATSLWNTEAFKRLIVTDAEEIAAAGLTATEYFTVLKSVTESEVVFQNNTEKQRPLSSKNVVDGYYLGKVEQAISKYTTTTVYKWEKDKVTAVVNGEERKIRGSWSSATFLDSNQILLYVRSLEKTQKKFQDSPTVSIYRPHEDILSQASFAFSYSCPTVIHAGDQTVHVKLNAVAVLVDATALLIQLNLPDTVNSEKKLDVISNGELINKYTTVRFRSGVISYELTSYNNDIVTTLAELAAKK